jgi:phage/plasmid-like protein (TIGR03299 family)
MSDNVEVSETGEAAFVSLREVPWHGLGTVIEEEVNTAEMLRIGHLDNWRVRVEDVEVPEGYFAAKPQYRTVRDNPFTVGQRDILGYVGERYTEFQNEDLFAFGDNLLHGGRWETAGSLKYGTRVFGSLALDREVKIGGHDEINSYLLVSSSHDGTTAITAAVTPVRVVCWNTLNVALKGAKQTFKIRHTQSMKGRVEEARKALGIANEYLDLWTEEMDALTLKPVSNIEFEALVQSIYAPNDTKAGITRFNKKMETLWDLWVGDTVGEFFGTAYGAYNALNEELMWNRNGRGANAEENAAASRSGFNPVWNAENNRILEAVKAL